MLRDELVRFRARLIFYRNKPEVRLLLTFQNNNSFGWDPDRHNGKAAILLNGARFGIDLLPNGSYVFGSGIEKTWEVIASPGGAHYFFLSQGIVARSSPPTFSMGCSRCRRLR